MLGLNLCLLFNNLSPLGGYRSSTGEQSIQDVESSGTKRSGKWFSPTIRFCKGSSVVYHRSAPSRVKNLQPSRGTGSVAITIIFLLRTFQVSQNP